MTTLHHKGQSQQDLRKTYGLGSATIERWYQSRIDVKAREFNNAHCPKILGIDEHLFTRKDGFATTFVDLTKHKVFDVTLGRSEGSLKPYLKRLPGKSQVRVVLMDLSETYRSIARKHFPNALVVADRFHVIRLVNQQFVKTWAELDDVGRKNRGLLSLMRRTVSQTGCQGLDCDTTTTAATEGSSTGTTGPVEGTDTVGSSSTTGASCKGAECCTPEEVYCGEVCCAQGEVCNFTQCEQPGADCQDEDDCGDDEYCEYSLGEPVMVPDPNCMGGVALPAGKCLKKPPLCGPNDPPPDPNDPSCLQSCQYDPDGGFSPTLKFAWGGKVEPPYDTDIMMTPIGLEKPRPPKTC